MKKITSIALALLMALSMLSGLAVAEGEKLWTEEETPDGWTKVINEGGATLGYSKNSGLQLIEADGYAFKDLDRDGELDTFEDWRVDYEERAQALVDSGLLTTEFMMGLKMNPFSIGAADPEELLDSTTQALDAGLRFIRFPNGPAETVVGWNNTIQEYIESNTDLAVVVPATFIADPLGGNGVTQWPGNLGIAATFDPEIAAQYGETLSKEWRALGITMKVGPQIDLATEPRWNRVDATFGEDPQLAMDMTRAMINAWQSTYDEEGNDLGWGVDSVNTQIKHLWGEGAAEGGRESHTLDGAYNVYPGGNQYTHLLPFLAALDLPGLTEASSSAMTNYSIAVDAYGESIGGDRVATSFNDWKLQDMWRDANNWDGYILTDFGVVGNEGTGSKIYGTEGMTQVERMLLLLQAGCDAFGGLGGNEATGNFEDAMANSAEAYELGVAEMGQEEMDQLMADTTRRILKTLFNVGVVDNPYLEVATASSVPNNTEHTALAFEAQMKSVVMLKNSEGLISESTGEKPTVYIPWKFTPATTSRRGTTPASWTPSIDIQVALQYFNVVTDTIGTPTGEAGEDGNPTYTENDIVRASDEDIASCDFALVRISSPKSSNPTTGYAEDMESVPTDYEYLPISLQYRPYTANGMYVRFESIGGQITSEEVEGVYGPETVYTKEDRSYFGKSTTTSNESDLDLVLDTAAKADKVVVLVDCQNPMIFSEFEAEADAILVAWGGGRSPVIDDAAFLEIVAGNVEPSGLLPMQMPANMDTVEAQYEDVPRDMECYVDADGNIYDFTFGLNWSGVIDDERVAKYNVEPISVDATTVQEYFQAD